LITHSRAKRWWLERVHGYRVTRIASEPRPGLLGGITYRVTWQLESESLTRLRNLARHQPKRSLRTTRVVASPRRRTWSTPQIPLKH
jgi:hypothetical protein